jgi:hypothetical protein
MELRAAGAREDDDDRCPTWLARSVWLVAVVFGAYLRLAWAGGQPLHGDEHIAIKTIERGYGTILSTFDGRGSHAGFSLLQRLSMDLAGEDVLAYRLPSLVAGVLTLVVLYPLGRGLVGRGAAALATLALALLPLHVFYSRFARPYALSALLVFLLVVVVLRALEGRRRAWLAVAALAAFVPWVHLSAAGAVALVGVAALGLGATSAAGVRAPLAAIGAAAAVCAALHVPALDGVRAYLERIAGLERRRPLAWHELFEYWGGTVDHGLVLAAAAALGTVLLVRASRRAGLVLAAAALGPTLTLLVTRPGGGEWAYARYELASVALHLLAAGFLLQRLVRALAVPGSAGVALVAAWLALQAWRGPLQVRRLDATFAFTPWVLLTNRPRADEPYEPVPEVYRRLAASPRPLTLVEYPLGSATLLYRYYERVHGQRALVGVTRPQSVLETRFPYVDLLALRPEEHGIDWVIVHHDLPSEARNYHRTIGVAGSELLPPLGPELERVRAAWGPPEFQDELVAAWRFGAARD